jgi:hypothetical protein
VSHDHNLEGKFLAALGGMDVERARLVQVGGCPRCAGPLDRADYPRKPRGELGEAADAYTRRLSLCCRVDGCRSRATPPSLRFLGRKLYFAAVVVIASGMGRDTKLVGRGRVSDVKGVPVRTVRRWLVWWQTVFALSAFWTEAKALFAASVAVDRLPASLLERVGGADVLRRTLSLIAPITTTSVRARIEMLV